jgi:L-threonylcarbamoyladenylate synthase
VEEAAIALRNGALVAFPTETVYGLGANALLPEAVRQIYQIKGRPASNPVIVHLSDPNQIGDVAVVPQDSQLRSRVDKLLHFWPGPLTLVLPRNPVFPSIVSAETGSIAIRIPNHPIALSLINKAGVPIAAPSANRSSKLSPTTAEHVRSTFGPELTYILDGGPSVVGLESTVVSLIEDSVRILRPGSITQNMLEDALLERVERCGPDGPTAPISPGLLPLHYAPQTALGLTSETRLSEIPASSAFIAFQEPHALFGI